MKNEAKTETVPNGRICTKEGVRLDPFG